MSRGSLGFFVRNFGLTTSAIESLSLDSSGAVIIRGTQSNLSGLKFDRINSGSTTTSSSVALSVDASGKVILTNLATLGNINSPYDKSLTASSVTTDNGTASIYSITKNPIQGSYVTVFVNGQEIEVGNATTSSPCYFGTQSNSPRGFSASNAIQAGDYLYWNPTFAGFNLESGWRISLHYLITA